MQLYLYKWFKEGKIPPADSELFAYYLRDVAEFSLDKYIVDVNGFIHYAAPYLPKMINLSVIKIDIDLSKSEEYLVKLFKAISGLENLESIVVQNQSLRSSLKPLIGLVNKNKKLHHLDLSKCDIADNWEYLLKPLYGSASLKSLILNECKLEDRHISLIHQLLQTLPNISLIRLENNCFKGEGIKPLVEILVCKQKESNKRIELYLGGASYSEEHKAWLEERKKASYFHLLVDQLWVSGCSRFILRL